MKLRVAFVGFRHGHILSLHRLLQTRDDVIIAAACEEDAATRASLARSGILVTHDDYARMLAETQCDVVACGDYFGIRGKRLVQALEAGKHILSDKPLCTRLDELAAIEHRARAKARSIGCMLDLVDLAPYRTLRRLVREGAIGEVHTVCFSGQHPLNYGSRAGWYFEEGKHGGTLNDIAIHAFDAIPWITGRGIAEITAARAWNARVTECPSFQDGAQCMLRLDNDGGAIGDVSYLAPDAAGYSLPSYWRFLLHGADGCIETACNASSVVLFRKDEKHAIEIPIDPARPGGYFEDFLAELGGHPNREGLHSERVLRSARIALRAQAAADSGTTCCLV